jgi:adenylate cyclase
MAIFNDLFLRFNKQLETKDGHSDDQLKTHYYKANLNQLFQSVEKLFREDADCRITTVSKEHGEIAVEVNKPIPCFLIATVVSVKPLETAVDFNISSEQFSFTGTYPVLRKRVISYYEKLNQLHTLLGISKNA